MAPTGHVQLVGVSREERENGDEGAVLPHEPLAIDELGWRPWIGIDDGLRVIL